MQSPASHPPMQREERQIVRYDGQTGIEVTYASCSRDCAWRGETVAAPSAASWNFWSGWNAKLLKNGSHCGGWDLLAAPKTATLHELPRLIISVGSSCGITRC